jgi:2-keto-4-pentenoate hydratase/2-oxohepta-3-ene-1,7-dioic acid hydratase in catechol pathway
MRWGRVEFEGSDYFGTIAGEELLVHEGDMFAAGRATGRRIALSSAKWLIPCRPSKMIALWNNFHASAAKNGWAIPAEPLYFCKTPNSFSAHEAEVRAPAHYDGRVVYEGELGVVIGANQSIFGYCCVNDMTALDLIGKDPAFPQWVRAKSFDGFGAFGPVIAQGLDPMSLTVTTLVNERERQNYPISDAIFTPAQLVSLISREITLEPGDVIACGTSLGVLPMRPGSIVDVAIAGIGSLRTHYR